MPIRFLIGLFFTLRLCFLYSEPLQQMIQGEAAVLINKETGTILFEKEGDKLCYPASTTKVATALYVLKQKGEELDTLISADQEALVSIKPEVKRQAQYTLPPYWQESDGTHIGIKKDEILSLRDLLGGMLIVSGNDAANVIAHFVGEGSIPQFMERLNQFLKELGCQHTTFFNPHGLHHPQHQTTAHDLALITREALNDSTFCQLVSQTRFIRPKTNKQKAASLVQTNRLLRPGKFYYSKAIGVKTGYHSKAKHTFIGAARVEDRTLILVLLGYPQRSQLFEDAIKLFEAAFNQPKVRRTFLAKGAQKFTYELAHADKKLEVDLPEAVTLDYYPAEDPQGKCLLFWDSLTLPIKKGEKVGEVQLVAATGQILKQVPLQALDDVNLRWPYSWISLITHLAESPWFFVLIGLVIGGCLLLLMSRQV